MAIEINYSEKTYQIGHEIRALTDLIISDMNLLNVLSEVYMLYDKSGNGSKFEDLLNKYLKIHILTGDLSEETALKFKEKWTNMTDEKIGIVLEQIIAHKGPYECVFNKQDYSREVEVYETKLKNNFDVVFFEKNHNHNNRSGQTINIEGYIEFHECKKNICNHIPNDPGKELGKSMRNKIKLIKLTKELTSEGKFYIPTFYINVKAQEEYLDNIGCGYVEILNLEKLIDRYCG